MHADEWLRCYGECITLYSRVVGGEVEYWGQSVTQWLLIGDLQPTRFLCGEEPMMLAASYIQSEKPEGLTFFYLPSKSE